jgi:oligoendopeptidase F
MAYSQKAWDLAPLFPGHDSPELKAAFAELDQNVADVEALRPQLTPGITQETFLDIIRRLEAIQRTAARIYSFAGLAFYADTQNPAYQTLIGQVQQKLAVINNRVLFFELWWKGLENEEVQRLVEVAGDYRYWLEAMRLYRPYTLSEAEEKVINLKNVTGASALNSLYDMLTNRYMFKVTINGEEKEVTRGELMTYVRQSDPKLRASAYQEMFKVFEKDASLLDQIYENLVRDWYNENISLRNFSQPISARNLANNIPDEVVDTLLGVCQKNALLFQRYFRLKARILGLPLLRRYDLYAPVAKSEKQYPFEQAAEIVLDSFKEFHPRFSELARRVFDENRLDSEVRKGKRSGAFCASYWPEATPYMLVNYQGKANDVATMAHELGHAIHSMLSSDHSMFTYFSSLPMAETASTFGEMMLVDRLLAEETDPGVRKDLLFRQMDDAYATIMRQAYFAIFERRAHELIQQGASMEELSNAYFENLKEQFGDSMEISDEFRWEWISIPHIYNTPFYVYAYAFGQLLVFALYRQFKQEGEAFKPRYIKILAAGGSASPEQILQEAGIDMRNVNFWQGGFDVIKELLENLEALQA